MVGRGGGATANVSLGEAEEGCGWGVLGVGAVGGGDVFRGDGERARKGSGAGWRGGLRRSPRNVPHGVRKAGDLENEMILI